MIGPAQKLPWQILLAVVTILSFPIAPRVHAQVCYMEMENDGLTDLSHLCEPKQESSNMSDDELSNDELAEIDATQAILDEVFEACSPDCNTEEEYARELERFCIENGSCPTSLFDQDSPNSM